MARRRRRVEAVLLAPGAGASSEHHTLVALAAALSPLPVRRMDFPYRIAGRRAPDRPPVLLDAVRTELDALCAEVGCRRDRVVVGGRSMGGRICSMVAAEGAPVGGVVLLSYPLHPPGKPDRLRTEHFGSLDVPCLFVGGEKDPFGSPAEFDEHLVEIAGPVTRHWLPGGHQPKPTLDPQICELVVDWIADLG
jgi:hypothetical protein